MWTLFTAKARKKMIWINYSGTPKNHRVAASPVMSWKAMYQTASYGTGTGDGFFAVIEMFYNPGHYPVEAAGFQ